MSDVIIWFWVICFALSHWCLHPHPGLNLWPAVIICVSVCVFFSFLPSEHQRPSRSRCEIIMRSLGRVITSLVCVHASVCVCECVRAYTMLATLQYWSWHRPMQSSFSDWCYNFLWMFLSSSCCCSSSVVDLVVSHVYPLNVFSFPMFHFQTLS